MKAYIKMGKKYKIWWYWNPKPKISPAERTYLDQNIDIYKTVVSNKVFFGKKVFKYFIGYKNAQN